MLKTFLSISLVWLTLASFANADEEIKLTKKISGKHADISLRSVAPQTGFIRDNDTWKKLWTAWRPNDPLPQLDFGTSLVLVETVNGPNNLFPNQLTRDDQGDLKYEVASTRMAGPGFGYVILVVPNEGIVSVNGQPLTAPQDTETPVDPRPSGTPALKPVPGMGPPAKPVTQPGNELPPLTRPQPDPINPAQPTNPVQPQPAPPVARSLEFVKVDMVGQLRSGIMAIGGETTGTLISAQGIIWELDLQGDAQLIESAAGVGTSLARVRGTLRRLDGTEISQRWIVEVESLVPVEPPTIPAAANGLANSQPNGVGPDQASQPKQPEQPKQLSPPQPPQPVELKPSYKSISITTTGGLIGADQTQTIDADGNVSLESRGQSTDQWKIDPARLAKLHQFVADADWTTVPRLTRSGVVDAFNYSILIHTRQGVMRIFIDGPSVNDQPVIKQLFTYISRPQVRGDR